MGDKTDNIFLLFAVSCPVIPKSGPVNLWTGKIIETLMNPAFPAIAASFFDVNYQLSLYFALINQIGVASKNRGKTVPISSGEGPPSVPNARRGTRSGHGLYTEVRPRSPLPSKAETYLIGATRAKPTNIGRPHLGR